MLSADKWVYLVLIWLSAIAGGWLPLTRPVEPRREGGFPRGEAFSAGVFLALSLVNMLPSGAAAFREALPGLTFPIASLIALSAFVALVGLEHLTARLSANSLPLHGDDRVPSSIPVIMTCMIAAPSLLLGMALGISDPTAAALIFVAIVLHKGTAAFALALAMTRSRLSRSRTLALFSAFSVITPLGVVVGGVARDDLSHSAMLLQAIVFSLGAGTFLYMGTLHEMRRAAIIEHCCKLRCFVAMLAGVAVTVAVRWTLGEAHRF